MKTKSRFRVAAYEYLRGLELFGAFIVGRLPVQRIRLLVYRKVLRIRIGQGTAFHWRATFFAPEGIEIGSHSVIGNDCFLDGRSGLRIGSNVNIGGHVQVFTLEHDPHAPDFGTKGGPVIIGDYAYVATRAILLPDVEIGEGAVVASGAVVTKSVPPYTIVGGVPARVIGERSSHLNYELGYHMPFQ